ncbi:BMP family lipoprotein [Haliangium sp.]|uniref:BMP family lipoprotein n=1 Tax=Haliangium sp. TaxID=2663208 RepID=UPI003D124DFA
MRTTPIWKATRNATLLAAIAAMAFACSKTDDKTNNADDPGAAKTTPDKPAAAKEEKKFKIGLVFDVGGLGDKSFNDSAHRGLEKAKAELGVETRYIEPGDGSDRESALRQLAAQGYDLVIGVGFIFSDDITGLAKQFPDVKFACVDYNLPQGETAPPPNLVGLRFREHEGSFLVGAIAGQVTKTKKVGFVGGMKIPLIRKFEAGYEAGVKAVCPDCEILSGYAGVEPKAFADPTKGKELALTQYSRGADIIYHASGKTGDGVFNAAKQEEKMAIGVDSDQFHVAPCCVLTSMLKRVDVTVFETIKAVTEGKFESGIREFGLAEDGVAYVYDDNNKDRIPAEVKAKVDELQKQIVSGSITVPTE